VLSSAPQGFPRYLGVPPDAMMTSYVIGSFLAAERSSVALRSGGGLQGRDYPPVVLPTALLLSTPVTEIHPCPVDGGPPTGRDSLGSAVKTQSASGSCPC
jgi:hypothetical protein